MNSLLSAVSFLGLIPELVMLIVTFMYVTKAKSSDSALLFTGSLIHMITRISYMVIPYLTIMASDTNVMSVQNYYLIPSVLAFIGSVVSCIGLLMLIQKVTANIKQA